MKILETLTLATAASAINLMTGDEVDPCACVDSHGLETFFLTADPNDGFIIYTAADGNDYEYPWNCGIGQCAAWAQYE